MLHYDRGNAATIAIINWWLTLQASGDLERVFAEHALIDWLKLFDPPADFFYDFDSDGIKYASMISPRDDIGNFSFWVRKNKRKSRESLRFFGAVHDECFKAYKTMVIKDSPYIEQAIRMGYREVKDIPASVGRMAFLTKEAWDARAKKVHTDNAA